MTDVQTGQIVVKTEEGVGEERPDPPGRRSSTSNTVPRFIGARRAGRARRLGARPGGGGARRAVRFDGATLAPIAVVKSADLVGEADYARDVSDNALAQNKQAPKRQRGRRRVAAPLCPCSWGRRASARSRGRRRAPRRPALHALRHVAHTTVVLDTPNSSLEWKLQVLAHLAPLVLRAAGGAGAAAGARPIMRGPHAPRRHRRPSSFRCAWRRARGRPRARRRLLLRRTGRRVGAGGRARRPPRQRWRAAEHADARVVATRRQRARLSPPSTLRRRLARRMRRRSRSSSAAPTARSASSCSGRRPTARRWRRPRHAHAARRRPALLRRARWRAVAGEVQLLCAGGPLVLAYEIDTGGGDGGAARASLVAQHAHAQYDVARAAARPRLSASVDGVLQHQHTAAGDDDDDGCVSSSTSVPREEGAQDGILCGLRRGLLSTSINCRRRPALRPCTLAVRRSLYVLQRVAGHTRRDARRAGRLLLLALADAQPMLGSAWFGADGPSGVGAWRAAASSLAGVALATHALDRDSDSARSRGHSSAPAAGGAGGGTAHGERLRCLGAASSPTRQSRSQSRSTGEGHRRAARRPAPHV